MQAVDGYTLGKTIHDGSRTRVAAAVRVRDGAEVVLKAYLDRDREDAEARAQWELQALHKLGGPGVPRALELSLDGAAPVLVLERLPGLSLSSWVAAGLPDVPIFLDVSIRLADALAGVHGARLLHRDLNPTNVLVDPATLEVHLIDFELSRPLGAGIQQGESRVGSSGVAGMLPFLSPEQTGRMDRGVDMRSDLYSLGATLYFVLVGRPPFAERDPLALIHAHMARIAEPATAVRPGVPATLGRILSKLLHKAPEDRYQTVHALRRDLVECKQQLERKGAIDDEFSLGSADAPYRPLFSRKLHGREIETRTLHAAYERAAAGAAGVVLLSGTPGIGKSALIDVLRTPLAKTGGHLAAAKFDQYRSDRPYAGFAQALASLAQQLLTASDAVLAQWRSELRDAIGPIAGALTALVPDLAPVLGDDVPAIPRLGPAETRARLALAVQRFIQAAGTPEHPLVLSLDDLQWSDAASRDLLRELLLGPRQGALLVVGAYRDSEVGPGHPLAVLLDELQSRSVSVDAIALAPLGEEACAAMLAEALGRSPDVTRSLAACVARKTGNVPLLIQQFVYHMYDVGRIRFEPGVGWTWDEAALNASDVPDDAVGLMTAKIARLAPGIATVLEVASCIGGEFDTDALVGLGDGARPEVESALFALCDEGLLAPAQNGLRFTHDRIREAAQRRLGAAAKAQIHRRAARILLERSEPQDLAQHAFEIADHLELCRDVLDEAEQQRAFEVHLLAGKLALVFGAAATAVRYLAAARAYFRDAHWQTHAGLAFDVFIHSAEAALQTRAFESAGALLDTLERRDLGLLLRAQVLAKRTILNALSLPPDQALACLLRNLASLGVRWPAQPSHWRTVFELRRTDWKLRGALDESAFRPLPPGDHSRWMAPLLVMGTGGATMAVGSPRLLCLMTSWVVRAYRRHGIIPALPLGLIGYATARSYVFGTLREGDRYVEAARTWNARLADPAFGPVVEYMLHAYVYPCSRPRSAVVEPLRTLSEQLFEVGNLQYGYYALAMRLALLTLAGESLEVLEREARTLAERVGGGRTYAHKIGASALRWLRSGTGAVAAPELAAITAQLETTREARMGTWSVWIMTLALLGRFDEVRAVVSHVRGIGIPQALLADVLFFEGVAVAAAPRPGRLGLRRNLKQLERWARLSPDFAHMAEGLRAERARISGRSHVALASYMHAADGALRQGYRHHAAFLHERRSSLLETLRRQTEADQARTRASALYTEWGADAKAWSIRAKK